MLHRAANNAYSWWLVSHIRTKQSKWLEQNLQDMENKVTAILKLIEEDADSFARRAEMYYRKRPELINFVEETYRAYRALAERYDHISGELQNANNAIANMFPDQVQFPMDEEEDEDSMQKKLVSDVNASKPPKNLPDIPKLNIKMLKKGNKSDSTPKIPQHQGTPSNNLANDKAREEIDKLQKGILVLQTEKEFVKSSYESALEKYWSIEAHITEMQENVFKLQDEFNVDSMIEDDEARALMAATALRSCEETLAQLQEKQDRSVEESRVESERVKNVEEKLKAFNGESLENPPEHKICDGADVPGSATNSSVADPDIVNQGGSSMHEKVKVDSEMNPDTSPFMSEVVEKIDELVNKVLNLENSVTSQTALIKRLRLEADDLFKHLKSLEEDKVGLVEGSTNLSEKLKAMEDEMHGIQDLVISVKDPNDQTQTHLIEALKQSGGELPLSHDSSSSTDVMVSAEQGIHETRSSNPSLDQFKEMDVEVIHEMDVEVIHEESKQEGVHRERMSSPKSEVNVDASQKIDIQGLEMVSDDPVWQQLFFNGLENREKVLLTEYTSILRNYKDVKKKLSEVEKKSQESIFKTMAEVRELKSANTMKDLEIRSLKQKLNLIGNGEEATDFHLAEMRKSQHGSQRSKMSVSQSSFSVLQTDDSNPIAPENETGGAESSQPLPAEEESETFPVDESISPPSIVDKFRRDIDGLLAENLEFWLRFSNSFHLIQKFQMAMQGLETECSKVKERKKHPFPSSSSNSTSSSDKPEVSNIDRGFRELRSELCGWLSQNALLKEELRQKLSSLAKVQVEISKTLNMVPEKERTEFTALQAAKFQGEVLNIEQENNMLGEELQAGYEYVMGLLTEVDKILSKLRKKHGESGLRHGQHSNYHHFQSMRNTTGRSRIPLRSFIFGIKTRKSKPSIFSCVMNPAFHKQCQQMKLGRPPM
ncbi:hypothetical protein H6P81_001224 [Aristolochia fimbriata]|uniref:NAB domain-containing protein n=1 Tax=Aristolochia fimbriata TaxID=158543 RepID=A0AAV7F9G5_ARIFI|nr:hypothetical protein H6P81_001224 [Aristolochia fimbriata]